MTPGKLALCLIDQVTLTPADASRPERPRLVAPSIPLTWRAERSQTFIALVKQALPSRQRRRAIRTSKQD